MFLHYIRRRMQKMIVLTLILLAVSGVYSDSHSLRYYYTGVSTPGYGIPDFSIVGYLDDQYVELYSSDTGKTGPVASWMQGKESPEHWERESRIDRENEAVFRRELLIWNKRFNHTDGFHFVQVMTSCELRDDGGTGGYEEFRYDGEKFMDLDVQTGSFMPIMNEAQIIAYRWNRPDVRMGERYKVYLENKCIDLLKRFLEHGREVLERRVRPQVKVSGQEKGDTMKLHCQVYGFHPRAVDVKWMNREDEVHSYETTHVLPNPDGTYQIRVSAEVTPKKDDRYSCYVDHSSLKRPLHVKWERAQNALLTAITTAGVIILVIIVLTGAGFMIYKKNKTRYTAASASDASSDSNPSVTP
ncbi:major histocompatibility complex class I-related gene protein-like isoform X1 [Phyllobates terribilis]|uniref:major histocompatibility complex class I-related gene protein-like isoform X1 n=1 Tax=Phyllobates terribilis TaxID=111132 RepID=UPI003CCA78F9